MVLNADFKGVSIKLPETLLEEDEVVILSPCCCPAEETTRADG
jgi:hypothetical protein